MSRKILVVESDANVRATLAQFLKEKGYEIAVAADGMTAVDAARRENPALIVLDLVLPGGDGFTVIKRIKQIPSLEDILIIAVSGTATHHQLALDCGAAAFLAKPVATERLLAEIKKLLTEGAAATASGKKKILMIEDDPNFRHLVDTLFKSAGYNVALTADSLTAMSVVMREKPDLILLDIGLPGGDGIAVLKKLKANPALAKIPVIVCSARDPTAYHDQALVAGAVAYIQKPIPTIQTFLQIIRKALGEA